MAKDNGWEKGKEKIPRKILSIGKSTWWKVQIAGFAGYKWERNGEGGHPHNPYYPTFVYNPKSSNWKESAYYDAIKQ